MEMKLGAYFKKIYNSFFILEFEDWHFARNRGLNPKPFIDWFFWLKNVKYIDYGLAVNEFLSYEFKKYSIKSILIPGVLYDWVTVLNKKNPPFKKLDNISVGYFGGLTSEKGADFILGLIDHIRSKNLNITFLVSGSGYLENNFKDYSKKFPSLLKFYGSVPENKFLEIVGESDVIINTHCPMPGVFPF